jgi:hypothetical protein
LKGFILGIDHAIQYRDNEGRLKTIITRACEEADCDLIAEERNTGAYKRYQTVGQLVARERSIHWLNINIPDRVSEKLGILCDLNRRRQKPDNEDRLVSEIPDWVYFPHADCAREKRWLRKIVKSKHRSVLVLCGLIHVKPFAEKLREVGCTVSTASLCDYDWYRLMVGNKCSEVEMELTDKRF